MASDSDEIARLLGFVRRLRMASTYESSRLLDALSCLNDLKKFHCPICKTQFGPTGDSQPVMWTHARDGHIQMGLLPCHQSACIKCAQALWLRMHGAACTACGDQVVGFQLNKTAIDLLVKIEKMSRVQLELVHKVVDLFRYLEATQSPWTTLSLRFRRSLDAFLQEAYRAASSSAASSSSTATSSLPPSRLTSKAIHPKFIIKHTLKKYSYHVSCKSDREIVNQIGLVIYRASELVAGITDPYEFVLNRTRIKSGYIYMRKDSVVQTVAIPRGAPRTPHFQLFHQLTGCHSTDGWILTGFSLQKGKGLVNRSGTFNDMTTDWHVVPAPVKEITETETVWITNAVYLFLNKGVQNYNPLKTICFDNPFTKPQ